MKTTTLLVLLITAFVVAETKADKPVHVFIFSGQSNMAGMDPETGFVPEARMLFGSDEVVYIKVAKGGQPICRWVKEWADIAEKKGLDARHRDRILKGEGVLFYQPILDQYKEILEKYPKPASVTFCWMQGERDANGGADAAYKDALKLLIAKLRRDLERPDMNIVIGRIGDYALDRPSCVAVRKAQLEIANEDPRGAWVDVDDLNDREVKGKMQSVVHYNKEGYVVLGRRFARQGFALVTGKEPAEDGRPSSSADASAKPFDTSKPEPNKHPGNPKPELTTAMSAAIYSSTVSAGEDESKEKIWMKAPSLGVMPHMIAPVIDDVPEWDKGLGTEFNAEGWAKAFKDIGASYVYGVAKWHDGFCYWDTDTTTYKSQNDYIGQLIKACQNNGLRFVFYFNHHTEGNPEWEHTQLHDKTGKPYRSGYPFPKHTVYSEFRQFTLSQIQELLTKYGRVDGIWLDHFREITDVSDGVVHEAFEEMLGYPLKDANITEQREFSARSLAAYLQDIAKIAEDTKQDSFLITMNGGLRYSSPGDSYTKFIGAWIDYPSQEGHYIPRLEERVRRGGLIGKPLDIGVKFNESWHVIPGYENPLILNKDQAIAISSMALFHASSLWLGMIPDYDGSFGPNMELAQHVGEWFRTVRPHLDGIEPYRDVGFLMGNPGFYCSRSLDMANTHWRSYPLQRVNALDEVVMQINALREAGYAADMFAQWWDGTATWPNNLSCYRTVVIPEGALLDDKAAKEIREYVQQGGTVIGFAHSGRFDELGNTRSASVLEDLFGVKIGKQRTLSSEYNPTLLKTSTFEKGLVNGSKTLMDGKPTIWKPKPYDESPWIEVTFAKPVDVSKIVIVNSSGPTAHPNDPATTFIRGFEVSVPDGKDWKAIAEFKGGATEKEVAFALPASLKTQKLRLGKIVATTADSSKPIKMLEMADIQILDTNGCNWASHEPRYIGLVNVDASASCLLKAGECIPPIVAEAKPTTAKVLARLDTADRPPVIFGNRTGEGRAILLATTDGACRTRPALWSALLAMPPKNGPTYSVPVDHERFAVLMNRLDKGISLHVVDREGGNPGVAPQEMAVTVDTSRFGNVTDIYTVGCSDAKDIKRDGNKVTFTLNPLPSSTVLFEVTGGKPEADARRRTAPSPEFTAALADPMKVLNRDRKTLTAKEKQAMRLEAQKEAEDVRLELHGK